MPEVGGTEIQFADGKFVVDDVYAAPIMEATDRHPERFPFKDAMARMTQVLNRGSISSHLARVRSDHLKVHGL